MEYHRCNQKEIEILQGNIPIEQVLESIAWVAYEHAPVRGASLEQQGIGADRVDFSRFFTKDGLHMDVVNGRICKVFIRTSIEGKLLFDAEAYEHTGNCSNGLLDDAGLILAILKIQRDKSD